MKDLTQTIIDEIYSMNENELIELNNIYCESCNYPDSHIYSNDEEFFEMLNWSGLRVAQAVFYGDFNYSHEWITFNGYGNFETYEFFTTDNLIDIVETIGQYVSENYNDFSHLFSVEVDQLINE
jgi:hypothetical protein